MGLLDGGYSDPLGASNSVSVTTQYDAYGNPTLLTDARGHQTRLTYGAVGAYAGLYPTRTEAADGTAVERTSTTAYDIWTGLPTLETDADNGVSTSSSYDALGRPTLVAAASGKPEETRAVTVYNDAARRVIVRSDLDAVGDGRLVTVRHYDQLGRIRLTRTLEDASNQGETEEAAGLKVQTRYAYGNATTDPYGYVLVSNPYRAGTPTAAGAGATTGWSRTKTDRGGRVVEAQTFGGSGLPAPWGGNTTSTGAVTTAYDAEHTTVTEQAGQVRRSVVDALGRLARADEPDASGSLGAATAPAQPTAYAYDALGNLRKVEQGGQLRFFMYDSLGRLVRARNPEQAAGAAASNVTDPVTGNSQWSLAYGYDANGNLTTRVDARDVTADYQYDALNRNTTVTYSGGGAAPTPAVNRYYDGAAGGKGRLWWTETVGTSATTFDTYDALGRPKQYRQHFRVNDGWGEPFTVRRDYNRAGAVVSQTYPSGRAVAYGYDGAGRLSDFSGTLGDGLQRTYSSEVRYDQSGGMSQERLGTDTTLYNKRLYNSRGQLAEIRVGFYPVTDPDRDRSTSWQRGAIINHYSSSGWGATGGGADNNGNLLKQDIYIPYDDSISDYGLSTFFYNYDSLNRLRQAREVRGGQNQWVQRYDYDRWGNRTINQASTWGAPNTQFDGGEFAATNRLYAPGDTALPEGQRLMRYDASGNLAYDGYTGAGARAYDAENRMTWAQGNNSQTAAYAYDADGRRVKRNVGGAEVWQVYGLSGELLAEYGKDASPAQPRKEYGYRGGELLVTAEVNASGWGPPPAFSGPDPLRRGDPILLEHLTDLRGAVNRLRQHAGLTPYAFTVDPEPVRKVTTVKAEHVRQLRAALEEARSRLGLSVGGYAHPTLTEKASLIYAVDFQELRDQIRGAWQGGSGGVDLRWLVSDQLGTPRMVINKTGSLSGVTRHDYFPFGEEIGAGIGGRTQAQGYIGDNVSQKFTGKIRDDETGLDYFGARYYTSTQGRFTSPDVFWKDSQVSDPQSWNKYAYARNNPLKYIDPTGEKATVTIETDEKNKRGRITVNATIALWTSRRSGLSQKDLEKAAQEFKSNMEKTWSGSFEHKGIKFEVSVTVDVQAFQTKDEAHASFDGKVQNVLEVKAAGGHSFIRQASIFGGPDRGEIAVDAGIRKNEAGHEFAHMLGVDDRYRGSYMSSNKGVHRAESATASDYHWAFAEAVDSHRFESRPHIPAGRQWETLNAGGGRRGAPQNHTSTRELGAPLMWWR